MTISRRQFLLGASSAAITAAARPALLDERLMAETVAKIERPESYGMINWPSLYDMIMESAAQITGLKPSQGILGAFEGIRFIEEGEE
jgi:hypothetical protein